MKRIFLFFFASLLSISMFAQNDGSTKARAIPYDWNTGIHVSSEAGVGKWYVVMLRQDQTDYDEKYAGPFNAQGKTVKGGLTNINVSVVNPLDQEADIDVVAYIGNNETTRHFKLGSGGIKSMTFGAGAFVQMGIDRVFLYLVMDVTVTPEEAEQHEAVNVNVTAVENENTVVFTPIDFDWTNWPYETEPTVIPAGQETWVKIVFDKENRLGDGETFEFMVENAGASATTLFGGVSYDRPATSIQEESRVINAGAKIEKALDEAKLSIMPDSIYVRLKADQEIRLSAKLGTISHDPEAQPIFNINGAIEVELWDKDAPTENVYRLDAGHLVYKVDWSTLNAEENYYRQIEVTNGGSEEVTIVGQASKSYDSEGKVYSAVSKTVTIPAGQTYVKKIDKTMQAVVGKGDGDKIYALGPEFPDVTFKLTQQPIDPEFCHDAVAFEWDGWNNQGANSYKWYSVNIEEAKDAKADIVLTMESQDGSEANITVDLAAKCELGAPTQSYTGKSKSTVKTLSYSLYEKNTNNVMYVRVRTDKDIRVKAELQTAKTWNGTEWIGGAPTENDAARIEGNLTIGNGDVINALGLTLTSIPGTNPVQYYTITIENGGKMLVGKEGVKGSENVDQILVKEGGVLLIDPAATTNNKPFITANKKLHFGAADPGARREDKHEFIALPVDDREAMVGVLYYGWSHVEGWVVNGFNKTFIGYDVYQAAGAANYGDFAAQFKGRLADNKNQTLVMNGRGWHAFGNSWLDKMDVDKALANVGAAEQALHVYVATPQEIAGIHYGDANDEKLYLPLTSAIATATGMTKLSPMQGFFLYTESATNASLKYNDLDAYSTAAPAPQRAANNYNKVAAVLRGGNQSDFVYLIEGEDANAHKMISNGLAIYAEDGLTQVANSNLIGTMLTIQTNDATEYTLSFAWENGETLYLKDLENGNLIAMKEGNQYTFTADPNSVRERFQIVGRYTTPTGIENGSVIEGANKRIENGKIVIIKNGVKYDVLGAQL